eukprot:CAMPEP_0184542038 /NCGR_PEP_ID=MMETSP0199_2-20130426/1754_1 /TAXON_ID=1112570 /ORGANISM="Thraustochytrium sp., Strain LLF1b" /LENGTH=272 /DNA_ID=CAMNT_0026935801 /DNA_START=35 /DNA_END=853 /DNA_ORIENTATION=+
MSSPSAEKAEEQPGPAVGASGNVLYSAKLAPNPRRVLLFAAEAGLLDSFEVKNIDMRKDLKAPWMLKLNPAGQIPVLVLEDGSAISESVSICRFLEETYGKQGQESLFGQSPFERAQVDMWQRRVEIQLFVSGVGKIWLNNPLTNSVVKKLKMKQSVEARDVGQLICERKLKMIDEQLEKTGAYICGPKFTIADITLLCTLEFGFGLAGLKFDSKRFKHVATWLELVRQRPAVKQFPTPYNGAVGTIARGVDSSVSAVRRVSSKINSTFSKV